LTIDFLSNTVLSAFIFIGDFFNGGLFGAFYIFTTIFASPKIGFANMFSLVICGQIIFAILFDHFGLLGNDVHLINPYRIVGVVLLVLGVYIIQKQNR
jgi:bacterial/archaeal transporter family-2 protein